MASMTTTTIRVPVATRRRLQELAADHAQSIGEMVGFILADYEKHRFFAKLGDDFRRLQADADGWANYQAEVAVWEKALGDELADEGDLTSSSVNPAPSARVVGKSGPSTSTP